MSDEGFGLPRHSTTWQREPDVRTPFRPVRGAGRAAVRLRDQRDDREPEPAPTAASRLVGAAEAVERAIREGAGEAGAGVGDVQLDDVIAFHREELDRTSAV